MICRSCGNQLPVDAQFCNVCGTKQEKSKSNTENECKKCGAKIIPGALFCNVCGSKISKEDDSHKCPKCGKQISGGMRFCAFCGFSINAEENQKANHEKQNSKNPMDHTYKRNTEEALDEAERLRKDIIYQQACAFIDKNTAEDLEAAVALFESISGWKDSDNKLIEALEEISRIEDEKREHNYSVLKKEMDEATSKDQFVSLSERFAELKDYKDAVLMKERCLEIVDEYRKNEIYKQACVLYKKKTRDGVEKAIELFGEIKGWRDSDNFLSEAKSFLNNDLLYSKACEFLRKGSIEDYENAIMLFENIGGWRDSNKKIEEAKKEIIIAKEKQKMAEEAMKKAKYKQIIEEMKSAKTEDDYKDVALRFDGLKDYQDAIVLKEQCLDKAEDCRKDSIYVQASEKSSKETIEELEEAVELFNQIFGWKDSDLLVLQCQEKIALIREEKGRKEKEIQEQKKKEQEQLEKDKLLLRLRIMN